MTIHIATNIKGLLQESDYRLKKMAPCIKVDGVPLRTAAQARRALKEAMDHGMEFIPAEGCDNYDEKGLCKGHHTGGGQKPPLSRYDCGRGPKGKRGNDQAAPAEKGDDKR